MIGKERKYENNELQFEIEIINGEKNGKVKEYYGEGKLRFEGKYLNGKRNGKGKEYDFNGGVIGEGEYLDDQLWNGKLKDMTLMG